MREIVFWKLVCSSAVFLSLAVIGCRSQQAPASKATPEARAVAFLQREVPAWSRDNGCYSCHNNGDAARALYAASRSGYQISNNALADSTRWLERPEGWDNNKGDPGFSDKRLADLQFAAALMAAIESGKSKNSNALNTAALRIANAQANDGSWPIDAANPVGSPATWGTTLATYMAWSLLKQSSSSDAGLAIEKAEEKLRAIKPDTVPNAAVVLLFNHDQAASAPETAATALSFLRRAQAGDGGWGPYADSPPEVFDTSLTLLALKASADASASEMIRRGRQYLIRTQLPDGSWPATTRPSGSHSYAQQMSTTGWATLALLATR